MADFDQQGYMDGMVRKVGAKRSSKDEHFEFQEHQMWDYNSVSNNVSYGSSSNPNTKQVYNNVSSSSVPMEIPDWRKIYGTSQVNHEEFFKVSEDEDEMIPPHEYIAKKLASNQISSFSVCEGAGRTLKGRDLSRVRNAILTKTGFLE